jgi:hypothetical protein
MTSGNLGGDLEFRGCYSHENVNPISVGNRFQEHECFSIDIFAFQMFSKQRFATWSVHNYCHIQKVKWPVGMVSH